MAYLPGTCSFLAKTKRQGVATDALPIVLFVTYFLLLRLIGILVWRLRVGRYGRHPYRACCGQL